MMGDGYQWKEMAVALQAPGVVDIRRADDAGLAQALIRLGARVRTDELFKGLPDDRCQCAHWGYIISGTMRVHGAEGPRDFASGEVYYWPPGHNLEAVTDAEYLKVSHAEKYDHLMTHCHRVLGGG
jgi:mannose-6-phosphate isomerase-like protein (cupin superfamily)